MPSGLTRRWPEIRQGDKDAVLRVLERGTLGGAYAPEAMALAEEFAAYLGCRHCLALNSGTAALHCAVAAAGVQPGDEVVTSALSFAATPLSILHHGAIPVFVDIDPRTFNLDATQLESRINDRTRAIMPVHLHGLPADMDRVNYVATKHGLAVIEDSAQAHGSTYQGRRTGTLGHMAAFSLHYSKNLPAGEGGLFVTDDGDCFQQADRFRLFGEQATPGGDRSYETLGLGWNYRIPELSAALARRQLMRLDGYNATGRRNAAYLSQELDDIAGVTPPFCPPDRTHIYHKYRVRLCPEALGVSVPSTEFRDKVLAALQAEGVAATLWQTVPLPGQPLFRKEGLGGTYPWQLTVHGRQMKYNACDYPRTVSLLENSIIVGSDAHPIYAQPTELMGYYVQAFRKVSGQIESLVRD